MTLAEQQLSKRTSTTVPMPLALCCYKCNVVIRPGEPANRYDAATFTHFVCPSTPHKTFAPHKYENAR